MQQLLSSSEVRKQTDEEQKGKHMKREMEKDAAEQQENVQTCILVKKMQQKCIKSQT